MVNYQVLFSGDVARDANVDAVRDNLARELGLDERKTKQLFSGRTVVIRSQLDEFEAQAWQERLAQFGALCRIKDLTPKEEPVGFTAEKSEVRSDRTLRDITAAHLECPRCSHMQLDSSHCARCGVDLEQALKAKRKEDLLIEKRIRELRSNRESQDAPVLRRAANAEPLMTEPMPESAKSRKGMRAWFKK